MVLATVAGGGVVSGGGGRGGRGGGGGGDRGGDGAHAGEEEAVGEGGRDEAQVAEREPACGQIGDDETIGQGQREDQDSTGSEGDGIDLERVRPPSDGTPAEGDDGVAARRTERQEDAEQGCAAARHGTSGDQESCPGQGAGEGEQGGPGRPFAPEYAREDRDEHGRGAEGDQGGHRDAGARDRREV